MLANLRGELTNADKVEGLDVNVNDVLYRSLRMMTDRELQDVRNVYLPAAMCAAAASGDAPQLLYLERQVSA